MKPLGIQMHSVREYAKDDYTGVLKQLAEIGYKGIETAALWDLAPATIGAAAADLGLTVIASHIGPAISKSIGELVDTAGGLGTDTIVCSVWEEADWTTMDDVKRIAEAMQAAAGELGGQGLRLGYHNHRFEMLTIDGKTALEHFYALAPDVIAEIDIYWAANFGRVDAPALVASLADRTVLLHLKDGAMDESNARMLTAIGSGELDIPPIVAAADESVLEWNIVEIDRTDGDMWQAVRDSYDYTIGEGLATGGR